MSMYAPCACAARGKVVNRAIHIQIALKKKVTGMFPGSQSPHDFHGLL